MAHSLCEVHLQGIMVVVYPVQDYEYNCHDDAGTSHIIEGIGY